MPERILKVHIQGSGEELRHFLRDHPLDLNCGRPSRQADGSFLVEAFVRESQVPQISRAKVRVTVVEDASAKGRERQKEVSRENRFAGKEIPRGLGRKI